MFITLKIVSENDKKENFYCQICKYPFVSKKDFESEEKFGCCHQCFLTFVECRKEEWNSGWRPSKKDIKTYRENRKLSYTRKIKDYS